MTGLALARRQPMPLALSHGYEAEPAATAPSLRLGPRKALGDGVGVTLPKGGGTPTPAPELHGSQVQE
jgi:hypothetical protein